MIHNYNSRLANNIKRAGFKLQDIKLPKLPISGSNLILPGAGAAAGGLLALLANKKEYSLKEKLKRLLINTSAGAALGTGLELGRVGIAQKMQDKITDATDAVSKALPSKKASFNKKYAKFDKTHLLLPAVGAGVSGVATLIGMSKTKDNLKDKIKRLLRNTALGATLGTGLELSRVGVTNLLKPKGEIDGNAIVDSNFVDD